MHDPTPPRLSVTGPRRHPPAWVWSIGARVGVRIGTAAARRTRSARAGRKNGARTLGGCRRGSRVVTRALSSRRRTNNADLQLMRGVQSPAGPSLRGPCSPLPRLPTAGHSGTSTPAVGGPTKKEERRARGHLCCKHQRQPARMVHGPRGWSGGRSERGCPGWHACHASRGPNRSCNSGGAAPDGRRGEPVGQRPVGTERAKWNASGQRTWRASGPATESTSAGTTRALEEPVRCLDDGSERWRGQRASVPSIVRWTDFVFPVAAGQSLCTTPRRDTRQSRH